jgi:hypothetical protein
MITERMDIMLLKPANGSKFSLIMLFNPVTM